jgi:hypothetical protein
MTEKKPRIWLLCIVVFAVSFGGLALASWSFLTHPSPHFHFLDLAESFLAGRLDTDTPNRKQDSPELPDDPPGLKDAVARQMKAGGWNDWVAYYEVALETGEFFKGVWPWASKKTGQEGYEQRNRFVTLSGDWAEFDKHRDVKKVCLQKPEGLADPAARSAWETRDKWEAQRRTCSEASGGEAAPLRCPKDSTRITCLNKRHFVSFPPLPAVLMLPFVAIWHYNFNDVIFTLFFAALNSVLLLLLLVRARQSGYVRRTTAELVLLVLLFTFGTVNAFSAIRGEVWYTALVLGLTLNLLYLLFATDLRNPFLAGLFLALGVATRVSLAYGALYIALLILLQKRPWDRPGIWLRFKQAALFALPCLAVGAVLMAYNLARFGSPTEFGHKYLLDGTRDTIVDHGLFSFWFLPKNLGVALTNVPQFIPDYPYVKISGHGLSILATTPLFFYLLWPRRREADEVSRTRYRLSLHAILWLAAGAIAMTGFLYQNTGWFQFGYRFVMDYLPFLMLLLAMDSRRWSRLFYLLMAVSVAVNLFGAITFSRMPQFYY